MKLFNNKNNPIKKGLQKFLSIITGHAPKAESESQKTSSYSSASSQREYSNQSFNTDPQQKPGHLKAHKQYTLHDIGLAGSVHRQVVGSVNQEGSVRYHQHKKRPEPTHDNSGELIDETAAKLSRVGLAGVKKQNKTHR